MGLAGNIDRIGYHMRELRTVDDRGERVAGFGTGVSQIKMEGWSKGRVALVGDYSAFLCVANGRTRLSRGLRAGQDGWRAPGRLARIYRIEAGGCRANFDRICTKDLAVPAQSSDSGVPNLMVGETHLLAGISNCSFLTTAGQLSR